MAQIVTRSPVRRSPHTRAVAGLIGTGLYVVAGWVLLSRLLAGGIGPIYEPAPDGPAASTFVDDPDVAPVDRGATRLKVLIVSIVDGPTGKCVAAADLVTADEIMVRSSRVLVGVSGLRDCVLSGLPAREAT
jgi:hypothetical protein